MTQAAYARSRRERGLPGTTKNAVWAAVQAGRIRLVDGLVDPAQADRDWDANTDPTKQVRTARGRPVSPAGMQATNDGRSSSDGASTGPSTGTYNPFRVKTEDYKSRMAEMRWAKEAGLLVDRDAFIAVSRDRNQKAMQALRAVGARLGPVLAGISNPAECTRRIDEEMDIVVRAIADVADGSEPR